MPRQTFTVGSPEPIDIPEDQQIWFDLEGYDRKGNPIEVQSFRCLDEFDGAGLTDTLRELMTDEARASIEVPAFIEKVLYDDDQAKRFRELTRSRTVHVKLKTLTSIMNWLMETYTGRPITRPSGSGSGQSQTTPTSMVSSHSTADLTPVRSVPGA